MATYGIDIITGLPYLIASDSGEIVGEVPTATATSLSYGTDIVTGKEYITNVDGDSLSLTFKGEGATTVTRNINEVTISSKGDSYFRYNQNLPSDEWDIEHNLNKRPSVTVTDSAGTVVEGEIKHLDQNNIIIYFSAAFSGYAELN
jgi:hypothetical protein